ncbi:MAG: dehypoxanthine futalosine cyclase [Cenarchaeum sp. SB0664_bin_35]|nr:dehypoxanthine futalosine cyclase [Cenarchaeum sp. SB0664_bin_35]
MSRVVEQVLTSEIGHILERSLRGHRPTKSECVQLLKSDDIHAMGEVAGILVRRRFGKTASFVNNIILNYTNVCITDCKFCAFYRPPKHNEAYTLTIPQIKSRVKSAWELFKIRQVLIQGGHNPLLNIEYYEEVFNTIRSEFPKVGIHGLSASEIDTIAKVEKTSTREVLSRLKQAGLQSVPGAGAEILVDSIKDIISPKKIPSRDWLRIMEEAHKMGLTASATMMYGHVESYEDIAEHMYSIVKLQEETGGFMAFIPWNFEPNNTLLQKQGTVTQGSGGLRLLKMIAISRILYDDIIPHIQSSWLTNGVGMAQLALTYGADDFGGTLIGEEVVSCTGARSTELTDAKIRGAISQVGYVPMERDNFYNHTS